MEISQIMLDLDGVLADFVHAAHQAHGRTNCYLDPSKRGVWSLLDAWGISAAEFWSIDNYDFWIGMRPMFDADEIVNSVYSRVGVENVAILTAPSHGRDCVRGRRDWVARYYPELQDRIIFGSAKQFMAAPNRLLVDDKDSNVLAFRNAGGRALLVPRLWNSSHGDLPADVPELLRCWK